MDYSKFTDRSRKVLQLANQEAQMFNHTEIDTAHILLGLAKEGYGVAGCVLKGLGVSLALIRAETEKLLSPNPEVTIMGKLPISERAIQVLQEAINQSKTLQHSYVGTEHILLALLTELDGIPCNILRGHCVSLEVVKHEIMHMLGAYGTPDDVDREIAQQILDRIKLIAGETKDPITTLNTIRSMLLLPDQKGAWSLIVEEGGECLNQS